MQKSLHRAGFQDKNGRMLESFGFKNCVDYTLNL